MSKTAVTVINYNMGNVFSVMNAFDYLGCQVTLHSDPDEIADSDLLVLPGVGSFRQAIDQIKKNALDQALYHAVNIRGAKLLGICLGMQLLGAVGFEEGETAGLGFVDNQVCPFAIEETGGLKIPHVGFNMVEPKSMPALFKDLPENPYFYFNHGYRMLAENIKNNHAVCNYGINFLAAFIKDNIYGVQFHPEKSQSNGLLLLKNFVES